MYTKPLLDKKHVELHVENDKWTDCDNRAIYTKMSDCHKQSRVSRSTNKCKSVQYSKRARLTFFVYSKASFTTVSLNSLAPPRGRQAHDAGLRKNPIGHFRLCSNNKRRLFLCSSMDSFVMCEKMASDSHDDGQVYLCYL